MPGIVGIAHDATCEQKRPVVSLCESKSGRGARARGMGTARAAGAAVAPYIIIVEAPREGVVQGHPPREHGPPQILAREESVDLIWLFTVGVLNRHVDHGPLN